MKTVAISGYWNPVHQGHIEYIQEARKLGDKLIVIVNNDNQVSLKGSFPFMDEQERMLIMSNLKGVDEVVLSIDTDKTVCKTLRSIRPNIFAKGGDRTIENIPEKSLCEDLNIEMVFGVGGGKVQSSSSLIKKINDTFFGQHVESKPWGRFIVIERSLCNVVKKIIVNPGQQLSIQYHNFRDEIWAIISGKGEIYNKDRWEDLAGKQDYFIARRQKHSIRNTSKEELLTFIEVQLGSLLDENDIVRVSDIYNRV